MKPWPTTPCAKQIRPRVPRNFPKMCNSLPCWRLRLRFLQSWGSRNCPLHRRTQFFNLTPPFFYLDSGFPLPLTISLGPTSRAVVVEHVLVLFQRSFRPFGAFRNTHFANTKRSHNAGTKHLSGSSQRIPNSRIDKTYQDPNQFEIPELRVEENFWSRIKVDVRGTTISAQQHLKNSTQLTLACWPRFWSAKHVKAATERSQKVLYRVGKVIKFNTQSWCFGRIEVIELGLQQAYYLEKSEWIPKDHREKAAFR